MRIPHLLFVALALFSCDRKDSTSQKSSAAIRDLPLLEPTETRGRSNCRLSERDAIVRARGEKNVAHSSLELGSAVRIATGDYVVAGLRTAGETRAFLVVLDAKGRSREVPLSVVHGSVELPELASHGAQVIVALSDNEATSHRLRVARVDFSQGDPEVIWGPEISLVRDESSVFQVFVPPSGERAYIVWDDYEKSAARSRIKLESISLSTMKPLGPVRVLSPPDHDAVDPRLVGTGEQLHVTWLRFGSLDPNETEGLVQEPPRQLYGRKLTEVGTATGEALALTESDRNVLVYDVVASSSSSLLVALREATLGHSLGDESVRLLSLDAAGSVQSGRVGHPQLGPGAPLLLGAAEGPVWLTARGENEEFLVGPIDGFSVDWGAESKLSAHIPLVRHEKELLTMVPDGLDLRLSPSECSFAR